MILGVSMSTFTLVHVPYGLDFNIFVGIMHALQTLSFLQPRASKPSEPPFVRFAAYCDGDIGRARREGRARIPPQVEGAGVKLDASV